MGRGWLVPVCVFASFASIASASSIARADCRPTAIPSGEPALVQRLAERLAANGIETTEAASCPSARVRVEQRGDQILVEITDRFGRTGTREVRDVATAATVVESWTSQEVEAGTLPALATPAVAAPAIVVAATRPEQRLGVAAAFDSAAGSDGSVWLGGGVETCVRVRRLCVGGAVRAARDAVASLGSIDHDTTAIAATIGAGLPQRFGRVTVVPAIGAGYGWQRLTEHHLDAHLQPLDLSRSSHGLIGDAHVAAIVAVARRIALYAALGGELALARTDTTTGPRGFARAAFGVWFGVE